MKQPCKIGEYNLCKVCDNEIDNCKFKKLSGQDFFEKYQDHLTYSNWSKQDIKVFKEGLSFEGVNINNTSLEGNPDIPLKKPPFNHNFDKEGPEFPYPQTHKNQ